MDQNSTIKNDHKIWISVLLCTYNDEKYIAETIQSILDQTYPYFEFIIVNDGSTDKTTEIIDTFKDKRIVHIRKPNTGLTDSLNFGLSQCQYNWIARIDGDDIALPKRLEKQIQQAKEEVAVIGTQYRHIDENGEILNSVKLPCHHEDILKRGLSGAVMFNHPSVLINKKLVLDSDGYDPLIEAAEDFDLWLKISSRGQLINLPDYLMLYRMHSQKISVLKRGIQFQNMEIAALKYRTGIFRNVTENEYGILKATLEKNILYQYAGFLNTLGGKTGGILQKIVNLQFRINQRLINKFIL